jgi:DNA mismatch endonuclease (patch repair protein)
VNGCFWHGHIGCKYFALPKTRTVWWREKIEKTIKRDDKIKKELKEHGWDSLVIWECELKPEKRNKTFESILIRLIKETKN